jgi:phosphate transport system ATP-binding protein
MASGPEAQGAFRVDRLTAFFGPTAAVREVSLEIPPRSVTAVIGPSGCGKSTFLRCLNRMHELTPNAFVTGAAYLDGDNIYAPSVDTVELRKRVGMVFQKPTPFPTMSIADNVAAGLRVNGRFRGADVRAAVERALRAAGLWDEVHDRLDDSALALSGGQQQRLCIARAIAPEPQVVLLDEPTSALDPASTQVIEELVQDLKRHYTVIIVTHNMQQAARVSDYTAFFYLGELVETGPTERIFTAPREPRTEAYVTGRFG